ncbi:MAG TPA: TonB-dependent receptor [Burkholderiaceae bacterium]|nr:TonB-dependent receptor [Burkholderiaceae bacterium]
MKHPLSPPLASFLALLAPACALAADPAPADARVVITATRVQASPFDVPASIDRIDGDTLREGRLQVNLSESVGGVPGLLARDRQNYAQDTQLSVRGFGARSTFGVRGVRLYVDGIPATLPDGQGQTSNIDLGSADRIEILRGPFSALYGNSSGGVIQVFTEDGSAPPTLAANVAGGSDGTLRLGAKASGAEGALGYVISASRFRTDGYRDHSAAQRDIGNAKLSWNTGESGKLTLVANSVALPRAEDPLGLTRAQYEADPRGVDAVALGFNTRKTVEQTQLGAIYERRLDAANALRVLLYGGHRGTQQFQAIPVGPQANPLHPGGVISLARDYSGTDLRWVREGADRRYTLVAGIAYDGLKEHRRGYQNFVGTTLGVRGALRRDEDNRASSFDQYLQGTWRLALRWSLDAGVRHSQVRFASDDHYVVGSNGNDSGSKRYEATLPVLGLMFAYSEGLHLYATAGSGFETPTLNELAYRPDGQPGFNFALQPSRSDNLELGLKARGAALGELTVALFGVRTRHEIVTQTNVGGRSTFQNAGATRRSGLELAWSKALRESLTAQAALTLLDARYSEDFATCTATPCAAPNQTVSAGNRLPGTARQSLFAALAWAPPEGWRAALEARLLSRVYVNDLNSDAAASYAIAGASAGYLLRSARWRVNVFMRGDNLFGRKYAGSVIVNEGNGRFFEPAPGRTWLAGLSATLVF